MSKETQSLSTAAQPLRTDQGATRPMQSAHLILTGRDVLSARMARRLLRRVVPSGRTHATGFRSVFSLDAPGDPQVLARRIAAEVGGHFGHVTAVLVEVESRAEAIRDAAVRLAREQIRPEQTFCFRLHKRGSHWLQSDTRTIERDIGGAIADAFAIATVGQLRVNLEDPDVKIVAEVLGPLTCIGVDRRDWRPVPLLAPARPIVADAAEVGASAKDRV